MAQSASAAPEKPLCFVISRIGPDGSDLRKDADKVLKHVITKALDKRYRVERADDIAKPGLITAQIVECLLTAPLVVADLTGGNANVYYELAIRHAANKPVIHIIALGEDAPFDVKDMRFVRYDLKDPDSIDKAQEEIREQADGIEKGGKPITPVQVGQILSQPAPAGGKDNVGLMLQAVYSAIGNLQQEMRETKESVQGIENHLTAPRSLGTLGNLGQLLGTDRPNLTVRADQIKRWPTKAHAPSARRGRSSDPPEGKS
jgi:hypothetical protein